jgi:regulator of nucleoside diphosphate kinase
MARVTKATTKARRRRDNLARRTEILDAAERALIAEGYQGATTDRIAAEAGVSVGTIYNTCGNKDQIYAAVVERVAEEMVSYVEQSVLPVADADAAVEVLVRYRLSEFDRQRLLFVLFSSERAIGVCPRPDNMPGKTKQLYYNYLDTVGKLFSRGMDRGVFARVHPLHLALSFEGMLNAFVGYWLNPERQESLETQARRLTESFLAIAGLKSQEGGAPVPEGPSRQVFMTSFDVSRLRELIEVARAFGDPGSAAHLDELEAGLGASRVVESAAVPRDVVTMNSRVRLRVLSAEESWPCTLVFPADAGSERDTVSILTPLGTALLGCRVGATIQAASPDGEMVSYEVTDLLYQPEAAGDFHR